MKNHRMRMSEGDWNRLRKHASISFRTQRSPETAAIALLGHADSGDQRTWLVNELMLPQPDDLKVAEHGEVVLSATFLRRAHLEMKRRGLIGLAIFHTHPMNDTNVMFSIYDNQEEPQLVDNLQDIMPETNLVSVVFGKRSQCGRVWQDDGTKHQLIEIVTVGERIERHNAYGMPPAAPPTSAAAFDRGRAVTGAGALSNLSVIRIAIVGCSGTGSIVAELLIRAGARYILLIDDDIVKEINLNRILHTSHEDAKQAIAKVVAVAKGIKGSQFPCKIDGVIGTILDKKTLALLRGCDVIFGCIDAATPRLLLSQFAFQYLLPYIDVGTELGGDEIGIASVDARATYVAPGRHCLSCVGLVTPRALNFEGLTSEERERVRKQKYSDDLALDQPAVMDLNMQASGLGTLILRHLLQPFMVTPLPVSINMGFVTFTMKIPTEAAKGSTTCDICRKNPNFGKGDAGPELGFDEQVVDAITGRKIVSEESSPITK